MARLLLASIIAFCLILTASASAQSDPPVRFDGHCVVRVHVQSEADLEFMLAISPDVWSHGIGLGSMDFRLTPQGLDTLRASGLEFEILIDDVQRLIDLEQQGHQVAGDEWFEDYKTWEQINARLNELAGLRPDLATVIDVGDSYEGREIRGILITAPGAQTKPALLINGCQHAREWVSPMTCMYAVERLIENYDTDARIRAILDTMEIYVVPVVNPDGYVYTWTTNRLWRKNRNPDGSVDLNRNWEHEWGGVGSSSDPRSDLYRGPAPFSEPETQAMRDFILQRPQIVSHVDFHSYSQFMLHPWGYTSQPSPDYSTHNSIAVAMTDAIRDVHGKNYIPGIWYTVLYPSSGIMIDWMYAQRGAVSYTCELRDTGQFGFILPADQIIPTAEEAFAGLLELAEAEFESPLVLDATSLIRGEQATLRAARCTPGIPAHFIYSLAGEGQTFVPQLNVTLDLDDPRLIASVTADAEGNAVLTRTLPPGLPPTVIWLQSAQTGRKSNVLLTQIN